VYYWYITEMEQRYEERLREAECRRYALEASLANPGTKLGDRALANVGRLLVEWGRQLEARHSMACVSGIADQTGGIGEIAFQPHAPRTPQRATGHAHRR